MSNIYLNIFDENIYEIGKKRSRDWFHFNVPILLWFLH